MSTVSVEEAQARLPELIEGLSPGEELVITRNGRIVGRFVGEGPALHQRPGAGLGKGMLTIVSEDDEHLADFAEYMP